MADYPKRDPFFAHRFVRLLQKSCAAMEIGPNACLLLCYIAHTEDAVRYSGPVKFWNEQLMTTMGFKSPKQLNDCREKAVGAGWLVYERSGHRQVGKYWVAIPAEFEGLDDSVIEPIHSEYGTNSGMNSGMNRERIAERIGDGSRNESRNESVTESGKPSIPVPDPNPKPNMFDSFWTTYPRRIAKVAAVKAWQKAIETTDPELIIDAAAKYATSVNGKERQYIKHPATWLNGGCWDDEPESAPEPEIVPGSLEWKRRSVAYMDDIWELFRMEQRGEITLAEYNQRAEALVYGEPPQ